jgi:hypothetical protein
MKIASTTILIIMLSALSILGAKEPQKLSLFEQVTKMVTELAASEGFSDEDATKVAVFFLEKLVGPKSAKQTLYTRIDESKPERVRVIAAYDSSVPIGFQFTFNRGDPKKGLRYAYFDSLRYMHAE